MADDVGGRARCRRGRGRAAPKGRRAAAAIGAGAPGRTHPAAQRVRAGAAEGQGLAAPGIVRCAILLTGLAAGLGMPAGGLAGTAADIYGAGPVRMAFAAPAAVGVAVAAGLDELQTGPD